METTMDYTEKKLDFYLVLYINVSSKWIKCGLNGRGKARKCRKI